MRWQGERESGNVEDRRSGGPQTMLIGGGGTLVLVVLALLFGVDPRVILNQVANQPGAGRVAAPNDPAQEETKKFVAVVLADTEDVWKAIFTRAGEQYREPHLVLFSGQVQSACGYASAAVGPFYCPGDERVYLDLGFFEELARRFKSPGDFAQAYVIAHEVGHHVQNLLGIFEQVEARKQRADKTEANHLSVRLELQADFLAGVWAHHAQAAKSILEPGDLEEAIRAANAIGDDRLQQEGQGYVIPDSFTHGTSEQRIRWFRRGFDTGDMSIREELFRLRYEDL